MASPLEEKGMAEEQAIPERGSLRPPRTAGRGGPALWIGVAGAALAVLVGVGGYAWWSGAHPDQLATLGYPGVFLVMFINGCSILFPVPGQAAVFAGGAIWNPLLVGVAAGLGNATGELTNYLLGRAAGTFIAEERRPRLWVRLHDWLSRYGFLTILTIAAIPNPIFDAVSLISGSLGYPGRRFWLACAIGNTIKYTVYAFLANSTFSRIVGG